MKLNTVLLLLVLTSTISLKAQPPVFDWAISAGGSGPENARSIIVDANGNSYLTGSFDDTVDFDPGAGVFNMVSTGGHSCFILKLDNAGNFVWAKSIEGTVNSHSSGASVKLDNTGNIIITGNYIGTVDFDPGPAANSKTSDLGNDIFILKLNPQGNFVWVKTIGGKNVDESVSCSIDNSSYIYVGGYFSDTVDFDPGAAVFPVAATGDVDAFILKLDSSGNFVFMKDFGGNVQTCQVHSIAVDGSGNITATGIFNGTVDFDPGNGVNNMTAVAFWDMFVLRLNNPGNLVWVKTFAECSEPELTIDSSGNTYITGGFAGTCDFDPGLPVNSLTSDGGSDIFILKLNDTGNYVWAKKMGNTDDAWGSSIAIDVWGKVYVTGSFVGTVDFDPGIDTSLLSSNGSYDLFISKLDSMGNLDWAKSMGDIGMDYANSIALDPVANVYTAGEFELTVDFNPDAGVNNLTSTGFQDIYVHKLTQNNFPALSNDINTFTANQIYPNPSANVIKITLAEDANDAQLLIFDISGKIVLRENNLYGHHISSDISMLPNGAYKVKLSDGKFSQIFNIVLAK